MYVVVSFALYVHTNRERERERERFKGLACYREREIWHILLFCEGFGLEGKTSHSSVLIYWLRLFLIF
jgi:hypothetical protein